MKYVIVGDAADAFTGRSVKTRHNVSRRHNARLTNFFMFYVSLLYLILGYYSVGSLKYTVRFTTALSTINNYNYLAFAYSLPPESLSVSSLSNVSTEYEY